MLNVALRLIIFAIDHIFWRVFATEETLGLRTLLDVYEASLMFVEQQIGS